MIDSISDRFPAVQYVMVDDQLHILQSMSHILQHRLRPIFPRQGTLDSNHKANNPS